MLRREESLRLSDHVQQLYEAAENVDPVSGLHRDGVEDPGELIAIDRGCDGVRSWLTVSAQVQV